MVLDPRKRQKKVEKRKAKEKTKRRELARRNPQGMAAQFERAAEVAPILHCCTISEIWDEGIGHVLVSRLLADGQVAFVAFLVDVYCLGVKNVVMGIAPRPRYEREMYGKLADQYRLIRMQPECARKLVESAVQYALDVGLPPHADYRKAKAIFGDIDASACTEEFAFGKDGKPYFFAGPHDSPARCRQIMSTLTERCGPNGFHFTMPVGGPLPAGVRLVSEDADDDDDDWS